MKIQRYGRNELRSRSGVDKVKIINEDQGFNASLVGGINNTFETTLPYPSEWDQSNEVMMIDNLDFYQANANSPQDDQFVDSLQVALSMIDRAASATFNGNLADINDEFYKSIFTPPMFTGRNKGHVAVLAGDQVFELDMDVNSMARYTPSVRVPALFPIFVEYFTSPVLISDTTGIDTEDTFAAFEETVIDMDYEIRRMTSRERQMMAGIPGLQTRWAQLGS